MVHLNPMVHHDCSCVAVAVIVVVSGLFVPFATGDLLGKVCYNSSYDTGNYGANVDELSNWLPDVTASSSSLFANVTGGIGSDTVYALALCRGDADAPACLECVTAALRDGRALCPSSIDTSVYHDVCVVRYSNSDLAYTDNDSVVASAGTPHFTEPTFPGWDPGNTRIVGAITSFVRVSLEDTARWAAYNTSARFATGRVDDLRGALRTLYSLAQCTPDMSASDCWDCLKDRINMTVNNFDGRQGGWRLGVRCGCRYETYPFYDGAAMMLNGSPESTVLNEPPQGNATSADAPTLSDAPTPSDAPKPMALKHGANRGKSRIGTIIGIALPLIGASFAIAGFFFYIRRRRQATESPVPCSINQEDIQIMDSLILNLSTLQTATNNFDECNKLGEGGFGVVYKGALPNGQVIAVKRLSHSSQQGIGELKNELVLVGKLQHKNLVRLVGVCLENEEKLLVYEYMPNRSLDTILFDPDKSKVLNWDKRFKIISEIARGLQYLHEESRLKIIHRDLKANNILLDSDLTPKISDFGLAKLFGGDQSHVVTHRVAGTYGYMAPEYAMCGQYSVKSDVFSFGVVVLEIVTGRRNMGSYNYEQSVSLLGLIWQHWTMGTVLELVDPSLSSSSSSRGGSQCSLHRDQMLRCVHIGLLCVQENPADRPMLSAVAVMLSSCTAVLRAPSRPAFFVHSADVLCGAGKSTAASPNYVSVTNLEPR